MLAGVGSGASGFAVVDDRRLNPLGTAFAASPPEVAATRAGQPVVRGGHRAGRAVLASAGAVGGFGAGEFAAGFVADVPDGRVGTGGVHESPEFGDGGGGLLAAGVFVVAYCYYKPDASPFHPKHASRTHVRIVKP